MSTGNVNWWRWIAPTIDTLYDGKAATAITIRSTESALTRHSFRADWISSASPAVEDRAILRRLSSVTFVTMILPPVNLRGRRVRRIHARQVENHSSAGNG